MNLAFDIEKRKAEIQREEEIAKKTIILSVDEANEMLKNAIEIINLSLETFEDEIKILRNEQHQNKYNILAQKFRKMKDSIIIIKKNNQKNENKNQKNGKY